MEEAIHDQLTPQDCQHQADNISTCLNLAKRMRQRYLVDKTNDEQKLKKENEAFALFVEYIDWTIDQFKANAPKPNHLRVVK